MANRVADIHQLTFDHQWRHIKSRENPTDLLSRGILADDLLNCTLWLNGPAILQTADSNFNLFESIDILDNLPEQKIVAHFSKKEENNLPLNWPLGRIVEIFPGKNNRVTVVRVQTNEGTFKRSITKLCLFPTDEENSVLETKVSNSDSNSD